MDNHQTATGPEKRAWRSRERNMMKTSFTTKFAAATGLTALLVGGLVPSVAHADPAIESGKSSYGQLSGVGSDTTQDVMNGLSIAIGRVTTAPLDWKIASYDATWLAPTTADTIVTKSGDGVKNTAFGRPNGSSEGLNALKVAIGAATTGSGTRFGSGTASSWKLDGSATDVVGDIQYSRSSAGPASGNADNGVVAYVPFAMDAVGYAISSNSLMPPLSKGTSGDAAVDNVTPSTLWAIYNCAATRIITPTADTNGLRGKLVNDNYSIQSGEKSTRIRAYIPQNGSGTQKFWQATAGQASSTAVFGATPKNCVESKKFVAGDAGDVSGGNNTFSNGTGADYSGASVQEHDGSALVARVENGIEIGDPGAIMPYSIPKWVGQAKQLPGVGDVRHGAVIGSLNGIAGTTGSGSNLTVNPAFLNLPTATPAGTITATLSRLVYNVVPYRVVTDPTTLEYKMFKGRTSLICSQAAVIRNYGFGVLTALTGASSCGDTSQRAVGPTTPTVTATATDNTAERQIDFNISAFTSNGNGGAKVRVKATNGAVVTYPYETTIAAGATSKTFSVPYSALAAGTQALRIEVTPNLPGVALFASIEPLVTKAGAITTVGATVSGKAGQAGSAVVTVTPSSATGSISIYKGTSATGSALATGTLSSGSATIALPAQAKGTVALFIVYSGDATNAASSKAVSWKVK